MAGHCTRSGRQERTQGVRRGWQHVAASMVEDWNSHVHQSVRPGEGPRKVTRWSWSRNSLHSHSNMQGPTTPSHLFRVLWLRRLRQQLPLTGRACGRLLDTHSHHRAACHREVLSRSRTHLQRCWRGWPSWSSLLEVGRRFSGRRTD